MKHLTQKLLILIISCNRHYITLSGCVDNPDGYDDYKCNEYEKYCSFEWFQDDSDDNFGRKFQAACKNTCSHFASPYCSKVICQG